MDLISCSPSGSRNLINLIAHLVRSMFSEIYYHRSSYRLSDTRALNLNCTDSEMCTVTFDKIKRMSEASASGGNLLRSTTREALVRCG